MANFVPFGPGRTGPFQAVLPVKLSPSHPLCGEGSPEGAVPGVAGQRYTDILTGDQYLKMQGNQNVGWEKTGTVGQAGIIPIG